MVDRFQRRASRLLRDEDGQDLVEYGLLAALIAVAVTAAVTGVGDAVLTTLWSVISAGIPKV